MATINKTTATIGIKSVRDLGSQFAGQRNRIMDLARWAKMNVPGILTDEVSAEARAEFRAGCNINFATLPNRQPAIYRKEGDKYAALAKNAKPAESDVTVSVAYALGFTVPEFAKLKRDNKALFDLVKPVRDAASTYASKAWADLVRYVKSLDDKTRERSPVASWSEAADKVLKDLVKRAKAARTKGYEAPDDAALGRAMTAFWLAIKQK